MAKKIVILDREAPGRFRYLLWADVPATRQSFYAKPTATSAYKDATQAEIDALRAGQVVEKVDVTALGPGASIPQVQTQLEASLAAFQAEITATNPWVRYGSSFDGSVWTPVVVS